MFLFYVFKDVDYSETLNKQKSRCFFSAQMYANGKLHGALRFASLLYVDHIYNIYRLFICYAV